MVRTYLELKVGHTFHQDCFGYHPRKIAYMAIQSAMNRCGCKSWEIDIGLKSFFDSIDNELMMKAVRHYTQEKWVLMYIERWLKADVKK